MASRFRLLTDMGTSSVPKTRKPAAPVHTRTRPARGQLDLPLVVPGPGVLPQGDRQSHPGEELEEAGVGAEVGTHRVDPGEQHLGGHRGGDEQADHGQQQLGAPAAPAVPGDHQQREEDVVLLLHRERPEVHERRLADVTGEVVGAVGDELPVGQVDQRRLRLPDQLEPLRLGGQHHEDAAGEHDRGDRGGQQPSYPPGVVGAEPEPALGVHLPEDHVGHHETGEHEEHVQHDEAGRERP